MTGTAVPGNISTSCSSSKCLCNDRLNCSSSTYLTVSNTCQSLWGARPKVNAGVLWDAVGACFYAYTASSWCSLWGLQETSATGSFAGRLRGPKLRCGHRHRWPCTKTIQCSRLYYSKRFPCNINSKAPKAFSLLSTNLPMGSTEAGIILQTAVSDTTVEPAKPS